MSDLVLIVGGPYNGQTTKLNLEGAGSRVVVPRQPNPGPAATWDYGYGDRHVSELMWDRDTYELRGAPWIRRFFPSWRSFGGEKLVGLMVYPSVRERGLAWRTMPEPRHPVEPARERAPEAWDRYDRELEDWTRRREYEERMLTDRLWQSHREFRLVSEVFREDLTGASNPGFMYGEETISHRWLVDLTPAQLEVEAEEKRRNEQTRRLMEESPKINEETLRRNLDRYAAGAKLEDLQDVEEILEQTNRKDAPE